MHGMGREMLWTVGNSSAISEDQLLSTDHKRNVIKSMESDISGMQGGIREAVDLGIFPPQVIEDSSRPTEGMHMATHPSNVVSEVVCLEESRVAADGIQEATQPVSSHCIILAAFKELQSNLGRDVGKILEKVTDIQNAREEFTKVSKKQNMVFRKLQDTQRFFEEDKDTTCPNLIYLGKKDSGAWATLKEAMSPLVFVRLKFACEAKYNTYRPHLVPNQRGLDVPALRPLLKKIVPWLKVSLTILSISAKIGANFVAPGVGSIIPSFPDLQQASSLLEGIEWATGFPKDELDKLMVDGMELNPNEAFWNPRDVYGRSKEAITTLIRNLSPTDYDQKLGLSKVCLKYTNGTLHGVVWVCTECLKDFRHSNLVSGA
ncbi:unnamed protein product [Calypogeia fissa]